MSAKRRQLMADANEAVGRGDHDRAVSLYRSLIQDAPDDERVLQRLGDVLASTNQIEEAVATFQRLADLYWKGGHAARSLAVLQRAIKLAPDNGALLLKLGTCQLDRGHLVDARDPLIRAARSGLSRADSKDAITHFRRLGEQLPRDAEIHQAQVDVATAVGDPALVAKARMALAVCHATAGQPDEAAKAFAESIEDDPEGLTAMLRVEEIGQLTASAGADRLGAALDEGKPASRVAASLLRGLAAGLSDQASQALEELTPLIAEESGLSNRHRLRLARVFGAIDQPDQALKVLETVGGGQTTAVLRRELRAELRQLNRRYPQLAGLAEARQAIGGGGAAVQGGASDDPAGEHMPEEVQARLVEVDALANHDLHQRALEVLADIPAPWSESDAVRTVREGLLKKQASEAMGEEVEKEDLEEELLVDELAAKVSAPAGSSTIEFKAPAFDAPQVEPVAPRSMEDELEDDLLILLEEDGEFESSAPDAAAAPAAPSTAMNQSPESDMGALSDALQRALDEEIDDETVYQMAAGLVQMELHDQAIPILERCLEGARCVEAATDLIQLHMRAERHEAAAKVARRALTRKELAVTQRADLLAAAATLALRLGDHDWLNGLVTELDALAPGHPSLGVLRQQV